jgi:hypothetical protein
MGGGGAWKIFMGRPKLHNTHFFPDDISLDVSHCSDLFLIWFPLLAEGYLISCVLALFFQGKINSSPSSIFHRFLLIGCCNSQNWKTYSQFDEWYYKLLINNLGEERRFRRQGSGEDKWIDSMHGNHSVGCRVRARNMRPWRRAYGMMVRRPSGWAPIDCGCAMQLSSYASPPPPDSPSILCKFLYLARQLHGFCRESLRGTNREPMTRSNVS